MRSTKRLLLLHSELVPSADKFIDVPSSFIHARLYESFAENGIANDDNDWGRVAQWMMCGAMCAPRITKRPRKRHQRRWRRRKNDGINCVFGFYNFCVFIVSAWGGRLFSPVSPHQPKIIIIKSNKFIDNWRSLNTREWQCSAEHNNNLFHRRNQMDSVCVCWCGRATNSESVMNQMERAGKKNGEWEKFMPALSTIKWIQCRRKHAT